MPATSKLERYRYISDLGRGGMSHVVLAEDVLLRRRVALKRMNASDDTRALLRLRREALIGASVSHPNLVSIYDIVAAGGGEYVIVMEYVEGETLRDVLARGERPPTSRMLAILDRVAAGLDAIHARRIVHRDVKPGNILLATNGDVKLADLGIASAPDRTRLTTEGAILGTLSYIAPEQLQGKPVTSATDVYALAAVAYEALAGRKARSEPNAVALAHAIMTQPPPDLRDEWREAPAEAAQLLIRAMAVDPAVRPRSATELTERLRSAFEAPPAAEPPTAVAPPPRLPPGGPIAARAASRPGRGRTSPELARASRAAAARRAAARNAAASSLATRPVPSRARNAAAPAPASDRREAPPEPQVMAGQAATDNWFHTRRKWRPASLLLGLLIIAAILGVLLSQGESHRLSAAGNRARSRHVGRAAVARTHPAKAGSSARAGSPASQVTGSTAAAPVSGGAPAPVGSADTPLGAAKTFYHLAAAHRYAEAWALADPTFRSQLGGYASFEYGQALDRSITFDSVQVQNETPDSAVIAVRTTSVRSNGTQHCAGTVELRRANSIWLLHLIHINCV